MFAWPCTSARGYLFARERAHAESASILSSSKTTVCITRGVIALTSSSNHLTDALSRGDRFDQIRISLLLNVLLNDFQRSATAGGDKVGAAPEHGLAIDLVENVRKFFPEQPAGNSFEVVGHHRGGGFRIHFEQQVDMIGFAAHLNQAATPIIAEFFGDGMQPIEHGFIETFAPVFRDENEVVTKRKCAVI